MDEKVSANKLMADIIMIRRDSALKRNGMVDIYRLIFILLIMVNHLYISAPFATSWIYVEFFFILSGYYTMRHYAARGEGSLVESASEAITYTLCKFKRIMPYVGIAVLLEYVCDYISVYMSIGFLGKRHLLFVIENMICELTLLSSSGLVEANLAPIWYLSAMFLVFPLFTFMLSFRKMHKWYLGYLSWVLAALYYGYVGVICKRDWPHDLLRAFVCLWLGVFVYGISELIKKHRSGKRFDIAVTLLEVGSFALTIACTGNNTGNNKLMVFAFIIGTCALVSGCSYTSKLTVPRALGELSMVLFLMHWPVKTILSNVMGEAYLSGRGIVLYYVVSILFSVLLVLAGDKIRMRSDRTKD